MITEKNLKYNSPLATGPWHNRQYRVYCIHFVVYI